MKKDKYDEAIEYLTRNPSAIRSAWRAPLAMPGGALFQYATFDGRAHVTARGSICGCLTQIRDDEDRVVVTKSYRASRVLAKAIRSDSRIPRKVDRITVKHLKRFAYWQRRLDKELGR